MKTTKEQNARSRKNCGRKPTRTHNRARTETGRQACCAKDSSSSRPNDASRGAHIDVIYRLWVHDIHYFEVFAGACSREAHAASDAAEYRAHHAGGRNDPVIFYDRS